MQAVAVVRRHKTLPWFWSGVTLVELILSITFMMLLLLAAVPVFQDTIRNNRRDTTIHELLSGISLARSASVTRSTQVVMCRVSDTTVALPQCGQGSGWESGWIIFEDHDNDRSFDASEEIHWINDGVGRDTTIRGNTVFENVIVFTPNGTLPGMNSGTLTLCDERGFGEDARQIIVSVTGQARSREVNGSGSCTSP